MLQIISSLIVCYLWLYCMSITITTAVDSRRGDDNIDGVLTDADADRYDNRLVNELPAFESMISSVVDRQKSRRRHRLTTTTTTTPLTPNQSQLRYIRQNHRRQRQRLQRQQSSNRPTNVNTVRDKPRPESVTSRQDIPKWLLFGGGSDLRKVDGDDNVEYEGYDGWYNNLGRPDLGAVDQPMMRLVGPKYSDGVYQPSGVDRPNPILLSEAFMNGEIGQTSNTGKTAFFVFFGQQIVEEILDAQNPGCPPEFIPIQFPRSVLAANGSLVPYRHSTGHTWMPLRRSRYALHTGLSPNSPRQQLNEVTPWLDGGLMYGTAKGWSDTLRSFRDGQLASHMDRREFPVYNDINLPMANPPPPSGPHKWTNSKQPEQRPRLLPVKRLFRLGNPRGHENPFLLTMGVIWFRWHNQLAEQLTAAHPYWSDEKVYNEARKWVIASYQQIVHNEWLPILFGQPLPAYRGYDHSVDPQISIMFQSAAFRFGHTLVTAGGIKRNRDCSSVDRLDISGGGGGGSGGGDSGQFNDRIVRTCNSYWKPVDHLVDNGGFEELIMGLTGQPAEREDNVVVEDLRGSVFGSLEFTRRDLMAINIQRGRDHGLPDYLTARHELGLDGGEDLSGQPIETIANRLWKYNIELSPVLADKLVKIYRNRTDKIDIWVGGLLETTRTGPGELFTYVIRDQFRRIRDGDRFWFENNNSRLFTNDEIKRLQSLTIYDIIRSITDIKFGEIQPKLFQLPTESSNPISPECTEAMSRLHAYDCLTDPVLNTTERCLSLGSVSRQRVVNDGCTAAHTYDYMLGSEWSYALTFFGVGVFGLGCLLALKCMTARRTAVNERLRKSNSRMKRMSLSDDITLAQEWVGKREGLRPVQINCKSSRKSIVVKLENGQKPVRCIDLREIRAIDIQASTNRRQDYLLLKVTNEYDLMLKFDSYYDRERFGSKVELFLEEIGVGRERQEIDLKTMMRTAYTKENRQKHLEQFFRVVFSHAFGGKNRERLNVKTAQQVIRTELTQYEFADALSMRPDSTFVQQMFALVDKDNNGYISFREFLDMIIIFAKGSADQKAKLMFDMYDMSRTGKLTVDEFKTMIRSMLELANQSISGQQMDEVIGSMFRSAGLRSRQELTFQDFQKLLGEYKDELGYAELNFDVGGIQEVAAKSGGQTTTAATGGGGGGGGRQRQSALLRANDTLIRAYSYFGDVTDRQKKQTLPTITTTSTTTGTTDQKKQLPQQQQQQHRQQMPISLLRVETQESRRSGPEWLTVWKRCIDEYKLEIFWITIYTAIIVYIFIDKSYTYTYLREHGGLRQIAGLGVTLTRGAASVQMFCYSTILLTMCRNILTFLRETFVHRFVPFDGAVSLHKYIAFWALVMSIIHSIGHAVNFYHISTQNPDDTSCLFREFYHSSHVLPDFVYWCWCTITVLPAQHIQRFLGHP
ncbi:dual oxidase-like isoform X2 [Oppia nitens]|uniref:dual oxidase-like isoform X2 n=1 Tax=Oppia nitens TaxID=1686743 RepID=UPI0023DAD34F|nr:dual oxidase-like isoform X2 [Oppia nitens]